MIVTPARIYPNGVDVTCDGCTFEHGNGEIAIRGGSSATIIAPL